MCAVATATAGYPTNTVNDNMGNFVASILSDAGTGSIVQGSDGNAGNDMYYNSVDQNGSGLVTVNAAAGNEEAALEHNSDTDKIKQIGDGNNNMDKVHNQIITGPNDSVVTFDVENTLAKTADAKGNNTVAQIHDNNNASNQYMNE